ncbi:hypothetical protein FHS19_006134 [Paenibacillus rhizosphaerae]|uniref:Uncharacterized protein n=1 Tax=Paenibacillus rhizosphaerae TaxID=297318 RepID=A0A839TW70_9BACL|nr:hypothetical protein [Paenibacillus rhizosphaerae]
MDGKASLLAAFAAAVFLTRSGILKVNVFLGHRAFLGLSPNE